MTTKENAIKKTFGKRIAIPLDLDFFKHPIYPYWLEEDLIIRLQLNSSKKGILCSVVEIPQEHTSFQTFI